MCIPTPVVLLFNCETTRTNSEISVEMQTLYLFFFCIPSRSFTFCSGVLQFVGINNFKRLEPFALHCLFVQLCIVCVQCTGPLKLRDWDLWRETEDIHLYLWHTEAIGSFATNCKKESCLALFVKTIKNVICSQCFQFPIFLSHLFLAHRSRFFFTKFGMR